ncbi:MAG TPA: glucose-6-phosphate dehydrogenase [Rhizomicrobium sp.]|nr:glucose-6-phosphate dehydrogenase [Rhizomicrobium sp.]
MKSALLIFGATGDLARRMLFPSLYFLEHDGLLPADVAIIGCSRHIFDKDGFASDVEDAVRARVDSGFSEKVWARFRARLRHANVDALVPTSFSALREPLDGVGDRVCYLSTSPALYGPICRHMKTAGFVDSNTRVVVEKPIGHDLKSCRQINNELAEVFSEDRIFRVDHYLGKEAVQNLIALRFANTLFEPLWNKVSIEQVQITVAETIGVEDRWSYYDEYGAIRDMVQNHLLQLLCLVAMEPPAHLDPDSVRNEKVKVLRSLRPITGADLERNTVRGQYAAGVAEKRAVPAYTDEAGGHESMTETFVAICANIDNWRWAGVPFYLRTGKRLPMRKSEIVIQFRHVPHSIFSGNTLLANRLVIQLQPEEEISLLLMNKTPSLERDGMELRPLALNLSLGDAFKRPRRRIAYERLLLEALDNKPTLFVRRDEAEAAWSWIDTIVSGWKRAGARPALYAAGSWGPGGSFAITERNGHSWYE